MKYEIIISHHGKIDPLEFFAGFEQYEIQRYFNMNLAEYGAYRDDPRSRAFAYVCAELSDMCEAWFGERKGVKPSTTSGWPDMDGTGMDFDFSDEEWHALVTAYPWIDPTQDSTVPEEWQPKDAGGTTPMEFGSE